MPSIQSILASLAIAGLVSARPQLVRRQNESNNPFQGRQLYVNPKYSDSLEETRQSFLSANDGVTAGKVQYVQEQVGSFVWISNVASLADIDTTIENARAQEQEQIIGLVLYDLPNRDCGAGESAGEFVLSQNGLERYKTEYVDVFAAKVQEASDLNFAIILEPDAIGNMVTSQSIPSCAEALEPQKDGIAYAIQVLQADHIHLYIDASNGGWLGTAEHIASAVAEFASIVAKSGWAKIRGFATNVSNYNHFYANPPEPFTEGSISFDENHYTLSLTPALEAAGLPARFIVDQGRVAIPGARTQWGDWCNVPSGFGQPATTETGNAQVDSLVWVKPGGESDGECGMDGAPVAGAWFEQFTQVLAENAHPDIESVGFN